jgi:PilZ domain
MNDINRQYKRIEKPLNIQFCFPELSPNKWDMSEVENISTGGIKFIAPTDLDLNNKIVHLKIRIPELLPLVLDIEAKVVNCNQGFKQGFNVKFSEVSAKFINISEANKNYLTAMERIMISEKNKHVSDGHWGKI